MGNGCCIDICKLSINQYPFSIIYTFAMLMMSANTPAAVTLAPAP